MAAMFVNGSGLMSNLYKGPSIDACYQFLVHLAKWFQRRRFLDIDQPETRIAQATDAKISNGLSAM
jgi:hypothetical protein